MSAHSCLTAALFPLMRKGGAVKQRYATLNSRTDEVHFDEPWTNPNSDLYTYGNCRLLLLLLLFMFLGEQYSAQPCDGYNFTYGHIYNYV